MEKITYEEKMVVLDNILETIKNYQTTYTGSSFERDIVVLECIKEDLEMYRRKKYKHWNIFFNGAKLEYLLYLEQKGKESFMTSISEDLFSKIKKHFLE